MTRALARSVTLVLCLLALGRPAAAQERVSYDNPLVHLPIATFMVAAFVDISTTEYGIGRGIVREANPLFRPAVERGPVTAALLKGTVYTGISWLLIAQHPNHPKLAFWTAVALTAAQVAVDVHNARTIGPIPR